MRSGRQRLLMKANMAVSVNSGYRQRMVAEAHQLPCQR
ncbi:hypothetical protein LTSEALA_5146 [Salmonella enterica subsp. enterica serovar Alachua str. R6-377]|uniref:Uncharacterized protein n=1 Tax=Salmonella enterica subsp. enterica serovar Alachua str. R6-377 TaxID=913241 RepID=G5LV53_SALET|nr:hypothetical protein LTSEALA_5146 [Salmonella enterica subsp. enterica serovar Alachua str. R6-377]